MTKTEFEKLLVEEGYVCEVGAQYPSVIVFDSKEVKTVSKKVRALCKKCGYDSSFAIRSYREGINTYPKTVEAGNEAAETEAEVLEVSAVEVEVEAEVAEANAAEVIEIENAEGGEGMSVATA